MVIVWGKCDDNSFGKMWCKSLGENEPKIVVGENVVKFV